MFKIATFGGPQAVSAEHHLRGLGEKELCGAVRHEYTHIGNRRRYFEAGPFPADHGAPGAPVEIHDELVFELPEGKVEEAEAFVRSCMEAQPFPEFDVPIIAEGAFGPSFGSMAEME